MIMSIGALLTGQFGIAAERSASQAANPAIRMEARHKRHWNS